KADVGSSVRVKLLPLRAEMVPEKPCSCSLILLAPTDVLVLPASFSLSTSTRCALLMVLASNVGNEPLMLLCTMNLVLVVIGTLTVVAVAGAEAAEVAETL